MLLMSSLVNTEVHCLLRTCALPLASERWVPLSLRGAILQESFLRYFIVVSACLCQGLFGVGFHSFVELCYAPLKHWH